MTPTIRCIVPEATRSGSTLALLGLLAHVRSTSAARIDVVVDERAELAPDLLALDDAVDAPPDVLLVNGSVGAERLLDEDPTIPAAVYVHEDGDGVSGLPAAARRTLLERAALVMCVSDGSRRDLRAIGVPDERLLVVAPPVRTLTASPEAVVAARSELDAAPGADLVVAVGQADWHKGPDLFIDVVRQLADRPHLRAAWIGHRPRGLGRLLDQDTRSTGSEHRLAWLGAVADPGPYLAAADVVAMPSRRDALPLVPLEAATLDTPTVAFRVGGLAAMADDGLVSGVDYPDTTAFAGAVRALLDDAPARARLAERGRAHVEAERTVAVTGPRFVSALLGIVGAPVLLTGSAPLTEPAR